MSEQSDVLIIGGGHNGLVCAAYLARSGLSVRLLERRHIVGGAAVTEEFYPGFRNSVASYTVSLLQKKIIDDLQLHRHGLSIVERQINNFLPSADGRCLAVNADNTISEVAKFSARDAQRLPQYQARLDALADFFRQIVLETPVNLWRGTWWKMLPELLTTGKLAHRFLKLERSLQQALLSLFSQSAGDMLDSWFDSDPIKALLGFDSIVGSYNSPYAAGSAYVLLHHVFGEVNGKQGVWGHAIGGMGAITQAMAAAATAAGADIRLNTAVAEVLTDQGRTCGVLTTEGEEYNATCVVSNLNPKLLFLKLLDPTLLPADLLSHMQTYRCASGTFRMNVALSELPDFTCLPGKQAAGHHTAGIILAPDLAYMDKAWQDARQYGWSEKPVIELLIPSTLDDSLAPPGQHVASLFCQHVAPELPDQRHWDDYRQQVATLMINTVNDYAPNFSASVLGMQALSPLDLEREFGLVGGDIFHGALQLDQLYSARPMLGYGDYRTPLPGLYQCGAGTHPGGGVSGAPGYNAAREILRDLKK